jgi:hypothetical protein
MALKKPIPSDITKRALIDGMGDYMDNTDPLRRILIQTPVALHVFTLGLDEVDQGIHKAKSAGWRFLAVDPAGVPVAGDVIEPEGLKPRMTGVSRDPIIGRAILAVREVESLAAVQGKDYELQVLRIPGVLTEAFWLKSLNGEGDLMVPVLTASKRFEKMRPYPVDEFFSIVRELAPGFQECKLPETLSAN